MKKLVLKQNPTLVLLNVSAELAKKIEERIEQVAETGDTEIILHRIIDVDITFDMMRGFGKTKEIDNAVCRDWVKERDVRNPNIQYVRRDRYYYWNYVTKMYDLIDTFEHPDIKANYLDSFRSALKCIGNPQFALVYQLDDDE